MILGPNLSILSDSPCSQRLQRFLCSQRFKRFSQRSLFSQILLFQTHFSAHRLFAQISRLLISSQSTSFISQHSLSFRVLPFLFFFLSFIISHDPWIQRSSYLNWKYFRNLTEIYCSISGTIAFTLRLLWYCSLMISGEVTMFSCPGYLLSS